MIAQSNWRAREILSRAADVGQLATNSVNILEILYSARNKSEHSRLLKLQAVFNDLGLNAVAQRRAIELQTKLAATSRHRVPITDLLIAADAECNDVELLHYDNHFDVIAEVSGLRSRWIVPRGTGH